MHYIWRYEKAKDELEMESSLCKTESEMTYGNRVSQYGFNDMIGQQKNKSNNKPTVEGGKEDKKTN